MIFLLEISKEKDGIIAPFDYENRLSHLLIGNITRCVLGEEITDTEAWHVHREVNA